MTNPLVIYDVGARGELQPHWEQLLNAGEPDARFVLFEPEARAAAALRERYASHSNVQIIQAGLYHAEGMFPLHVTRHATCSSLLKPDEVALERYNIHGIFEVLETVEVECHRMDGLLSSLDLPPPTFCKMDVQGVEYEVLLGMGGLLQECLGFELETHFYPIYKGERTLFDIVELLTEHDFTLRDLRPQRNFDNDLLEANAFFLKKEECVAAEQRPVLALLNRSLALPLSKSGLYIKEKLDRRLGRSPAVL